MTSKRMTPSRLLHDLMKLPGRPMDILGDIALVATDDLNGRIARLLTDSPQYDDRSAALVFTSLLEHSLENALATHFVIPEDKITKLFSYPNGPMSNFSAKIAMGYALGIYDEDMQHDLNMIREIRNAFAHARVEVTFSTPAVATACSELRYQGGYAPPRAKFSACAGGISWGLRGSFGGTPVRLIGSHIYREMYGARQGS